MSTEDRFNNYTERARKVLSLAEEEVRYFQHDALGTEHLLMGLIREEESVAARVLESLGITLRPVRKAVEAAKGRGNSIVQGEIGLTPHAHTALEMAMKEADRRCHPVHSPEAEMQLMNSIYMQESYAAEILQDGELPPQLKVNGITLEQVRKALDDAKGRGVQILFGLTPPASMAITEADLPPDPFCFIDTTNLLLGLLCVPESTAVKILQDLGMPSLKDVRTLVFLETITTLQTTGQGYAQRFTTQARKAWKLAHEEARRLQDNYVGGDHLLLGLVGEGSGIAATVLAGMGIRLDEMRKHVDPSFEPGDWNVPDNIAMQPHLKNTIELASNEARRLNHPSINTGHLLLVLIRDGEGQSMEASTLKTLGVDLDEILIATRRALNDTNASEQEMESATDEKWPYASYTSIDSIERDLASRELDKTLLAVYPFALEARIVLEDAWILAQQLAYYRVGPEHLLIGLTLQRGSLVSKVLEDVGIDFDRTQAAIEQRHGQVVKTAQMVLVQSPLCRAYLQFAADEAEQRDGPGARVKSEHLLLGLLREEKGIIADLLNDLGTSVETMRTKILEAL